MEVSSFVDPDAPELHIEYEPASKIIKLDPSELVNKCEMITMDDTLFKDEKGKAFLN